MAVVNGISTILKYYASNTNDALDMYAACISAAGWELFDQTSSPYGYVLKSRGTNNEEMPVYAHMYSENTNEIVVLCYAGWDADTHTGTYFFGHTTYVDIDTDDDAEFYIWCAANIDSFVILAYVASEYDALIVGRYVPWYEPCYGRLAAPVTAGSSQTITLSAGDAEGFKQREYRIFNNAHRELTNVTSVITSANQIVVDSLTYNYDDGDRIAIYPYRWFSIPTDFWNTMSFEYGINGTGNDLNYNSQYDIVGAYGDTDPDTVTGLYALFPMITRDQSNSSSRGIWHSNNVWMRCTIATSSENTVSIGDFDNGSGTVDTATSASITDTSQSWKVNEFANKVLIITAGTDAGEFRKIVSNTTDTLTVSAGFTLDPDGTSTYTVCEEGWLYFYAGGNYAYSGAMRIM